jgi:YesN/AraC family two-component response regulator
MVCERCKTTVKAKLVESGILFDKVDIGEVTITEKLSASQRSRLHTLLKNQGFELIDIKKNELVEKLMSTIALLGKCSDDSLNISYTDFISHNVNDNFIALNTLFSEIEGITIEKYIINQKVEVVKELLGHDKYSIPEIANRMHYGSVSKLSSQFKSITGLTPGHFRQIHHLCSGNHLLN